jgi:hypothetical protein
LDGFPIAAGTITQAHGEEWSTVDLLDDRPESRPPAKRHDKVGHPRDFVSHRRNEPKDAEYDGNGSPNFSEDEATRWPGVTLGKWIEIVADDANNNL